MTNLRTLTIDGTDIRTLTGVTINRLDLRAPGIRRGSHDVLFGKQGQAGNQLPYDAYTFSVFITVDGGTEWDMQNNLLAVDDLLSGTDGLVELVRRMPTGASTYRLDTAHGAVVSGGSLTLLNASSGQTELQFTNLSGAWWDSVGGVWRL